MDFEGTINEDFRGCIAIVGSGKRLFEKAYGYADLVNQVPNTLETKFATASAGKAFVAVGILQLIEKGVLHFEDTIGELLDFDLNKIDPKINIEQLLTHTSGIPDYFNEEEMEEYEELWKEYPNYKIRSNRDLIPLFIDKPMMYNPGERFQYNNTGYVVLALIIEKATKRDFDCYLQSEIFEACGMESTGYYELDRLPAKCAHNYIFDEKRKEYRTNIYSVDVKGTGAGGAFTTVEDVERFWGKLLSYELLSENMTRKMLEPKSGNEKTGYYGYGIWVKKLSETSFSPYFQGSDPGVSFISVFQPDRNMILTLVSNYGDNVWKIMRNIRENNLIER